MPVWDMPDTWAMPDTPDTVLELTDIMLDTMVSTETESRVLPVSTPLTFPFPVPPAVRGVMLRLNPRLMLRPLPTTVMLMVDTPMLPVLTYGYGLGGYYGGHLGGYYGGYYGVHPSHYGICRNNLGAQV